MRNSASGSRNTYLHDFFVLWKEAWLIGLNNEFSSWKVILQLSVTAYSILLTAYPIILGIIIASNDNLSVVGWEWVKLVIIFIPLPILCYFVSQIILHNIECNRVFSYQVASIFEFMRSGEEDTLDYNFEKPYTKLIIAGVLYALSLVTFPASLLLIAT